MAKDSSGIILLVAGGAVAWYGYTQGWFTSLLGTTSSSSGGSTSGGSSGGAVPLSVSIVNNTSGNASTFRIGDNFTVTVTGPPNSPVTLSGTQNGSPFGPVTQGTTNASGKLVVTGTMPSQNVGPWVETWSVGGASAGTISFTVSGGSSNQTSTPAALGALLTAAAGSGAQFGLDIDQWAYYYAQLPGRTALTGDQITTMMTNSGIPRSQVMDVGTFVGQLNSVGLSGARGLRGIIVPAMVRPAYGNGMRQYSMADFRRAGRR